MRNSKRPLFLLALFLAAAGTWAQTTHSVKMKEGTKDAGNWTIATGTGQGERSVKGDATEGLTGLAKGDEVRLKYTGRRHVKSITAVLENLTIDLSDIPASALVTEGTTTKLIVPNGTTLTGTLDGQTYPYKIMIPDGATVTLSGATVNGWHDGTSSPSQSAVAWAGITCEGDATIILADETTNTVKGFFEDFPGIYIAEGKTLTIKGESEGTGSLTASPFDGGCTYYSYAAGIGGGYHISCGNILIEGGVITAKGGCNAAGIGGGSGNISDRCKCGTITITGGTVKATGYSGGAGIGSGYSYSDCGDILISGGTVEATGGSYAAGIGSGYFNSSCGTVTITKDVTKVTATRDGAAKNIGAGGISSSGAVTIGCELDTDGKPKTGTGTVYYDGSAYQNGGDDYLAQKTLTLVNLGKLAGDYEAPDGTTLFGTLDGATQPYKVSIANNATVTLDGATINGANNTSCKWAGLTCAGTATIIVKDGTINAVKGFHIFYPGIFVPEVSKLTLKGGTNNNGTLTASSNGYGCGIGGGRLIDCGEIEIQGGIITANGGSVCAGIGGGMGGSWGDISISGGNVTAQGGTEAAGIGSGHSGGEGGCGSIRITSGTVYATGGDRGAGIGSGSGININETSKCGIIYISGGTVEATGGSYSAGIGTGFRFSVCDDITITSDVTYVTAKKGSNAENSIGLGKSTPNNNNSCGYISIGSTNVTEQ